MSKTNSSPKLSNKLNKSMTFLRRSFFIVFSVILGLLLFWASPLVFNNGPVRYGNINDHFKYGSIGSEPTNGIPYWIWKVLPVMFPEKLPSETYQVGEGYSAFGFIQEPEQGLPVGFSVRKTLINRVGLNCATCHAGVVRDTPDSTPQLITTMPSNTVNLQAYVQFLGNTALDSRFTPREMMPQIEALGSDLNPLQKLVYKFIAIPQTRDALIEQTQRLAFLENQPEWGPGRVDTFNPYKALQFNFPMDQLEEKELIGTADLPVIWQTKPREGLQLHWDGNNDSVDERNLSAALGAGVTPTTVDRNSIQRVADWLLELPPPTYPYTVDPKKAQVGKVIFQNSCASCHTFDGEHVGEVTPIQVIGTDPHRLDSYTNDLLANQNTLYTGYPWRFKRFRKTDGYANLPLDGVWLRAPYLHNGSVPTLRDLLTAPSDRPTTFYRGYDVYDSTNVGFISDVAEEDGKNYFKFDTSLPGNSNRGHTYGTDLTEDDKDALIEYLKQI